MKTKKFKEISNEWIELKAIKEISYTINIGRYIDTIKKPIQFNDYTMEQFNEDIIIAYFNKTVY